MSLKSMLEEVARRWGEKPAIVSDRTTLSYAQLNEASNKVANFLIQKGVNPGDRIAMLLSNTPEFVTTYFGIVKTGAVAVPLDPKYKIDELSVLFNHCLPKLLFTESPCLETLLTALPRFSSIKQVIDLSPRPETGFPGYQEIIAESTGKPLAYEPSENDIAHIGYTSGPSFEPRGVVLPHRCLVEEANISADGFQQTERDIAMLFALPLHHVVGLVIVLLTSISRGSTVVMVPGVSISALTETIERQRATIFAGVPFIFSLMNRAAEEEGLRHDLSSLRLCTGGGAPVTLPVQKAFKKHYGMDIAEFWGLTETAAHITCQPIDGSGEPGSAGKVLPGWKMRVVDDKGKEVPAGCEGELVVRGPIMTGYYNEPKASAEVVRDGWLLTGDIGRVDEAGYLFITGRNKDAIIVKGQNIYPVDIETVLCKHPKIAEAAVLGVPDEMRGEVVGAVVGLKEGQSASEQELRQFCLERLANYKVPRQIFFMKSLLKDAVGKVDKEGIRAELSIPPIFP
jgi:long-chain acyl-CoA synthetase